jgi:hypothetical protein
MKIIITEEQYGHLVTNLLDLLLGNITIKTVKEKKEDGNKEDYHSVFNEDGETVMTIWVKGPLRSKGCKKDLTLENSLIEKFEQYMPHYKHKMFSKVLVNYIYDKFGIKCDCVQYDYNFEEEKYVDDEGDEYEVSLSKTRRYNVKKKKKIKESVEDSNVVKQMLEMEGIDVSLGYGSRVYDDIWGKPHDSVYFWFDNPNYPRKIYKNIWYITKNNKVTGVDILPNFKTVSEYFEFVPVEILNSYFIEMGKKYLEEILPSRHPNDSR